MSPFWKRTDPTVKELWMGIVLWGLLCSLVLLCFVTDKWGCLLGLWIGCFLAAAGVFHMWRVLDRALDLGEGAQRYTTSRSLLRYAVFVLVFIGVAVTDAANPFTVFLGLMGMKAAAYFQPFLHKEREKRSGRAGKSVRALTGERRWNGAISDSSGSGGEH